MHDLGKVLVVMGFLIALAGGLLWSGLGRGWLGRLPGDIHYAKGNVTFFFPLMTCVILSLVVSVVLWLLRKL
jgi:hypothetical protein